MFSEANSISGQLVEGGSPPGQPFVAGDMVAEFAGKARGPKVITRLVTVRGTSRVAGARGQGSAQCPGWRLL